VNLDEYVPFSATIGDVGRMVVPQEVRIALGIEKGTSVQGFIKIIK